MNFDLSTGAFCPSDQNQETKLLGCDAFTGMRHVSIASRSPEPLPCFTNHLSLKRNKVGNAFVT